MPGKLYANKAYADASWVEAFEEGLCFGDAYPKKKHKGDTLGSSDTFSIFVSSICQPIERFFNQLNRLTNIQSVWFVICQACISMSSALFLLPFVRCCSTLGSHQYFISILYLMRDILRMFHIMIQLNYLIINAFLVPCRICLEVGCFKLLRRFFYQSTFSL